MPDWKEIVPDRYRVAYDKAAGSFKILDCWHESIKNISSLTQDVPDDSPAIKVVSSGELNALIGEMNRLGWGDKLNPSGTVAPSMPMGDMGESDFTMKHVKSAPESLEAAAINKILDIVSKEGIDTNVASNAIGAIREIVSNKQKF